VDRQNLRKWSKRVLGGSSGKKGYHRSVVDSNVKKSIKILQMVMDNEWGTKKEECGRSMTLEGGTNPTSYEDRKSVPGLSTGGKIQTEGKEEVEE